MNCPKCGKAFPDQMNVKMNFCPGCGERLFEAGRTYLIQIQSNINSDDSDSKMLVFVDDRDLYETRPMDSICFPLSAGFHTLQFRYKIRSKNISLLVSSGYVVKTGYNTLSGLIETNVNKVPDSEDGIDVRELDSMDLTRPIMVSNDGSRSLDVMLGDDDPEYELSVTSGLKQGVLRLYEKRLEFLSNTDLKKDVIYYSNVVSVKPKMGSIDVQCAGNVHKVYSIPKDNYNEVIAFLTNKTASEK